MFPLIAKARRSEASRGVGRSKPHSSCRGGPQTTLCPQETPVSSESLLVRRLGLSLAIISHGDEWVYVNSILPHSSSGSPNPNRVTLQLSTHKDKELCGAAGVWKRPILASAMRVKLQTRLVMIVATAILHNRVKLQTRLVMIVATAILHNIAIEEGEENPPPPDNIDNVNLENNFENGQIDAQPLDGEHDFAIGFFIFFYVLIFRY
ncbi:hypothetical protein QE152_g29858 [Popillia japonica]|uniref:DDE Tnp4 domain-containing protein n=1 Tax=Popillia japonica TaxID=7064 RepID=A0AAW1JFG4_POPJA